MAAIAALLASAVPVATGVLFESIIPRAEYTRLPALVLGLCVCAASAAVFELTKAVALLRLEGRMDFLLQPALIQRLLELPVRFFRDYGAGDLNDRVLGVQRIRRLLTEASAVSLLAAAFSVVSIGVVLCYSVSLALLAVALGTSVLAIGGLAAYLQLRQERIANDIRGREDSLALQMIQGIAKLRVTASESRLFVRWAALFAAHKTHAFRAQRFANLRQLLFSTLPLLAAIVLFAATAKLRGGATLLTDTSLSLGDFLAVNAAFGQFIGAISAATNATSGALTAMALFARLRPVVAAQPEQRAGGHDPGPSVGSIELSHVSFRYGADTPWVLNDVSLRIAAGEFVAVVGASGSGKSTLLRLLLGFESAAHGDILFADRPINTLDTAALRRHVGVVLQNGKIATGSLFENIVCGLDYSLDDAWAAARMAGLDAEIQALPMGMHTMLVEGNATLSGGQYQRLMIARALIGKPQLLIFDEATSALDNNSQATVAASLRRLRATRIVIAHRLSTVRDADRIFVLDAGRLVESGRYEDLMAQRGAFHALAQRQLL